MRTPARTDPTRGGSRVLRHLAALSLGFAPAVGLAPTAAHAQAPRAGEVRQLVTFSFLPGRTAEALALYRDRALPLYERDDAMLSFRAFREVESPVPLSLVVVRAFEGMAGMDASNERLREMGAAEGTPIGALYGEIGALSDGHTDQFVEMLPSLGWGDPSSRRLTAFVWYRATPGGTTAWERDVGAMAALERSAGVESSTGRFLVSDDWSYLRTLGFDSLGAYQAWVDLMRSNGLMQRVEAVTSRRRETILANVVEMSVR